MYKARFKLPHGNKYRPDVTKQTFLHLVNNYWMSNDSRNFVAQNPEMPGHYYDWRKSLPSADIMVRYEAGHTTIFSNDLEMLQTVESVVGRGNVRYTKVVIVPKSITTGIKYFRTQPQHKYRIYLRSRRISGDDYQKFVDFLREYRDKFRMSPAFITSTYSRHYGHSSFRWLSSSYFIDYDTQSLETWLDLKYGEYLGKRYELRQHDDAVTATSQEDTDVVTE
jgi:hypothetical protein